MKHESESVDLRRDTTTRPDRRMKDAAFAAALGDSVYGEDPDHNTLERRAAEVLGKQAAIFLPSGTMGNLIALLVHTGRAAEVILEQNAHIRTSETGNAAAVGGLMLRGVPGPDGIPAAEDVAAAIRADDIHYPRSSLICLETSHYRYGGIVPSLQAMRAIRELADQRGLPVHLDGARIWNAAVALDVAPSLIAGYVDSVMASLSKGLGAPVGSVLAGSERFIAEARRYRKMLGGGMRQTGWLCAAALVALEPDNLERLRQDHRNARALAEGIAGLPGIEIDPARVQTNFVLATVTRAGIDAAQLVRGLAERGVLASAAGSSTVRFVTCSEVNRHGIDTAIEQLRVILER